MSSPDRSVVDVVHDIAGNLQDIVRSEVLLAKAQVRERISQATTAGLLVVTGALTGLFGAFFVLLAGFFGLSLVVPAWAAALVLGTVLTLAAGVTVTLAARRLPSLH